jgi:hypothetical protein
MNYKKPSLFPKKYIVDILIESTRKKPSVQLFRSLQSTHITQWEVTQQTLLLLCPPCRALSNKIKHQSPCMTAPNAPQRPKNWPQIISNWVANPQILHHPYTCSTNWPKTTFLLIWLSIVNISCPHKESHFLGTLLPWTHFHGKSFLLASIKC